MKPIGRLHAITDTILQQRFDHLELAQRLIDGGADVIQYREKAASCREMIAAATAIQAACRKSGVAFIVNDRVDVALAADADGVHLGLDDFPVALARRILGPDRIIGASVDTAEEGRAAWKAGADYVGYGPIYGTGTKSDTGPVVGVDGLARHVQGSPLPVVAIGGCSAANIEPVLQAGARGVAVISALCRAPDPTAATREIADLIAKTVAGEPS
ncbi:MAG: thiamine phosphate synthase [Candidatus Eisenbacteria bacterium]|nr:thiamine phosphate synthase [Candidatus Eisenbacteria bacterium]